MRFIIFEILNILIYIKKILNILEIYRQALQFIHVWELCCLYAIHLKFVTAKWGVHFQTSFNFSRIKQNPGIRGIITICHENIMDNIAIYLPTTNGMQMNEKQFTPLKYFYFLNGSEQVCVGVQWIRLTTMTILFLV